MINNPSKLYSELVISGGDEANRRQAMRAIKIALHPHMAVDLEYWDPPPGDRGAVKLLRTMDTRRRKAVARMLSRPGPRVTVYELGHCDLAGAMSWDKFRDTLTRTGISIHAARDSYTAVVHLTTPNVEAPTAWLGQAHLVEVPLDTDWDVALGRVASHLLGLDGGLEIERKFLLQGTPSSSLPPLREARAVEIKQVYLTPASQDEERRIRKRTSDGESVYYLTTKRRVAPGTRQEDETEITESYWMRLLLERDPNRMPIEKTRYHFMHNHHQVELDIYHRPPGLAVAEIELADMTTGENYLPDTLAVVREVTEEKGYSNSSIAKGLMDQGGSELETAVFGIQ